MKGQMEGTKIKFLQSMLRKVTTNISIKENLKSK